MDISIWSVVIAVYLWAGVAVGGRRDAGHAGRVRDRMVDAIEG